MSKRCCLYFNYYNMNTVLSVIASEIQSIFKCFLYVYGDKLQRDGSLFSIVTPALSF